MLTTSQKISHKHQPFLGSFIDLLTDNSSDPGVHFHSGLSDCKVIIGEAAELECKLSSEECNGIWYKDGEEVSPEVNKSENEYVASCSWQYRNLFHSKMFCLD